MRLVDADKIKEQFDPNTWQGEMMIAIVNGLPTAYDVDKVVEQLGNVKWDCNNSNYASDIVVYLDDAIEIVKGAVKDE